MILSMYYKGGRGVIVLEILPQVAQEQHKSLRVLHRGSIQYLLAGCIKLINDPPFILPFALIMFGGGGCWLRSPNFTKHLFFG